METLLQVFNGVGELWTSSKNGLNIVVYHSNAALALVSGHTFEIAGFSDILYDIEPCT